MMDGGEVLEGLTPRLREVAVLVAEGLSNREIAEALVISPDTVRLHVNRIGKVLGVEGGRRLRPFIVRMVVTTDLDNGFGERIERIRKEDGDG